MSAANVTVLYPAVVDGKVSNCKKTMPRAQVIAKLDGTAAGDQLKAAPDVAVMALLEPEAIQAWLMPDELAELLAAIEAEGDDDE